MTYTLKHEHLKSLFEKAQFEIPNDEFVFVGLRGSSPVDIDGTDFAAEQEFDTLGTDYVHMRCSLVQWRPKDGTFAAYPGSTVPFINNVRAAIARGGSGVNQLATCYLRDLKTQDHRYVKGDHGLSSPLGPHRAFRSGGRQPVWRTADDADFEGDDRVNFEMAFDNLHCSRQSLVSAPKFSSNGCQVVAGAAGRPSNNPGGELGPWKKFIDQAYGSNQKRFRYALFEQGEAPRMASDPAGRSVSVRFGSSGALAKKVQKALADRGFDVGVSGADGEFGMLSMLALRAYQLREFVPDGADLIAGRQTMERLGVTP